MPIQEDFIEIPDAAPVTVALESAGNAFHSLSLLAKAEELSGLSDWVTRTANALTPRERKRHKLVFYGLYWAMVPERSWASFPAYVDHLATRNPTALRDKILAVYAQHRAYHQSKCMVLVSVATKPDFTTPGNAR